MYQDVSADELRYYLASEHLDVSDLIVLGKKNYEGCGFVVTLSVLGTSHSAHISYDDKEITEVFACKKPFDSKKCHIVHELYMHNGNHKFELEDFVVETSFKKLSFCMDELRKRTENTEGMVIFFPNQSGAISKDSVTWVYVQFGLQEVVISSMHTYPNENAIVLSKTIIKTKNIKTGKK